jgi:hypothetical protein
MIERIRDPAVIKTLAMVEWDNLVNGAGESTSLSGVRAILGVTRSFDCDTEDTDEDSDGLIADMDGVSDSERSIISAMILLQMK